MKAENMEKSKELKEIIKNSKKICVFTGAGISCPSGIPDFRSADGLYNQKSGYNYSPEEIISHSFFVRNPDLFYDFYKSKMLYPNAQPNKAHRYFADLEKQGKDVSVVTQNIDGLHQKAGSSKVFELHGSVARNYCTKCKKSYSLEYIANSQSIPRCTEDKAIIKPDVVLYEEPLDGDVIEGAINAIMNADTLIVIGTSLVVYPAASFIRYYKGKNMILINKSKTSYDTIANMAINEDVIEVVEYLEK